MDSIRIGIQEFLLKYSAPTSLSPKALPLEKFHTVISVHKGSPGEQWMRDYLKNHEWIGNILVIDGE